MTVEVFAFAALAVIALALLVDGVVGRWMWRAERRELYRLIKSDNVREFAAARKIESAKRNGEPAQLKYRQKRKRHF